ncbi:MAG TPA: ABC transporter substrate-binding protein [Gaiellaceae bacterium]|nr:ABC transporter substrate-binding protein [Gaiellaceae bacterium]
MVSAGERRVVSVLMADIVGSTAIAERLGPERSKFLFDELVRLMCEQVRSYDGTVAQLTGDGVYALYGAPVAHEGDSERAVRAALGIHDALAGYSREVADAYDVGVAARVAVNTGPVVVPAGDAPLEERFNALGDTVNVAARLQPLASAGEVVVGPLTARQIEARFELEPLGEAELKGKTAPVASFRVVGEREAARSVPTRPLFGRSHELKLLDEALENLVDGRGAIVSITGEAGIGKSRIVTEARVRAADRVRFLEGHAVAYAETFPFWPFRELLRGWLGLSVSAPEAQARLELKTELARLLGDGADDAFPFIATLLGLDPGPDGAQRILELSRESVQRQTFDNTLDLVQALAAVEPLCLVLEDLQWADDSTLELAEELFAATEEEAVALLLVHRSEREHPSWTLAEHARQRYPHRYRELELGPLDEEASRELAGSAAAGELPESVEALLTARSGGNPFFLEEALYDLVERGALRRTNGSLELADGTGEVSVPALVQEALQARLDRLDPETRDVLNAAAVIGRTFTSTLLERVRPETRLGPALSELQRLELVVEERRRPVAEYRFRHGLVQEVAYASLLEARRQNLHLQVGEALEEAHREAPEQVSGLLGRHFAEAGDEERAVRYLLSAGDSARRLYADEEALAQYHRALELLAPFDRRVRETYFKIALTHHAAFDFAGADDAWARAAAAPEGEPAVDLAPVERLRTTVWRSESVVPGVGYTNVDWWLSEQLFRGLLRVDRDLNVVLDLARECRVSHDGCVYRFRLRPDARWSDGAPIRADDFVLGWVETRERGLSAAKVLRDVEDVRALDNGALEIRLEGPRSYFPYVLATSAAFPWPRHRWEELGDDWMRPEHLVCNGPFELAAIDEEHMLIRASGAWRRPRGNVAEVQVDFGRGDDQESWAAGLFDFLVFGHGVEEPATIVETVPQLGLMYVGFGATGLFEDERLRRAFTLATDDERVARKVIELELDPAAGGGMIPPAMPGHSHRVALRHDLDRARQLLADAGYSGGRGLPTLKLLALRERVRPGQAAELTRQWAEIGAQVSVEAVSISELQDALSGGSLDLWLWGWNADFPDPHGILDGFARMPVYRDDEILELIERARSLRDQAERMRLFREVERLWIGERAAIVPIGYIREAVVRRPWVEGLWATALSKGSLDEVVVRRDLA